MVKSTDCSSKGPEFKSEEPLGGRERDRETDRERERQRDRETERQRDRETEREREGEKSS